MKNTFVVSVSALLAVFSVVSSVAEETVKIAPDPQDLVARREEFNRTLQRVSQPVLLDYLRQLEFLKQQYTRRVDLKGAQAVDGEIAKIKQQLDAATAVSQGARRTPPLEITSALWQGQDPAQSQPADVTAHFKKLIEAGTASIRVTTKDAGGGVDPAYLKPKMLVLEYAVHGVAKKKIFKEGETLNFADLK